ncbi:sulfite transporter Ssu1 [Glarea lozoyensis ATCC 20868]|uniref:Sulfite efflux pump SSU1 n=1 Tax=Glarea lozoyensis (strain ATCC 20868 / MF5171) TaxID=1116229 RepID=S3DRB5_GLAL2|nr:sulfite transporter Ssu1 [Glarea lozoyensis ATCC 20868]EPE29013.1 sulfite transporter Ssu1 [Glarea lozoyensis ATCC 20868]
MATISASRMTNLASTAPPDLSVSSSGIFAGPSSQKFSSSDPPATTGDQNKSQHADKIQQSTEDEGWRKIVRNFTPSWFSVNMGTGIVSILLHTIPFNGSWLYWISIAIFALNVILFCTFFAVSFLRYTLYPEIWGAMIRHPGQSLFLGTFPMGLATIINMLVLVCVPVMGHRAIQLAWTLWWFDAAVSIACCFYVPFAIMTLHTTSLNKMTAPWLLPIVAPIVAAATGAVVASVLPPQEALWTIIASYILWGIGVPTAMVILVIYFQRLTMVSLPPIEVAVSVFLPLGPLGQGGYGIMKLGKLALIVFPETHTLSEHMVNAGEILYVVGWLTATIMWGFALVWLFFAVMSVSRMRFPFNMGWWAFTFPLGVFTSSTLQMGRELPSRFFDIFGTITATAVTLLWIVVAIKTIQGVANGTLFVAPDLASLKDKSKETDVEAGIPSKT